MIFIGEVQAVVRFLVGHGNEFVLHPLAVLPHGIAGQEDAVPANASELTLIIVKGILIPCVIRNGIQIVGHRSAIDGLALIGKSRKGYFLTALILLGNFFQSIPRAGGVIVGRCRAVFRVG